MQNIVFSLIYLGGDWGRFWGIKNGGQMLPLFIKKSPVRGFCFFMCLLAALLILEYPPGALLS